MFRLLLHLMHKNEKLGKFEMLPSFFMRFIYLTFLPSALSNVFFVLDLGAHINS